MKDFPHRDTSGRAFITGASGFIGRNLLQVLLEHNREVVALCRNPGDLDDFVSPLLTVVPGTMEDIRSWALALKNVTTVFHLAAQRSHIKTTTAQFLKTNLEDTLSLAQISLENKVNLFLNVSTALIFDSNEKGVNPGFPDVQCDKFNSDYRSSRRMAYKELMNLHQEGLPLITACPTIVFGPDSPDHPNQLTDQIRRLLKTRLDIVIGGGIQKRNLVFIRDVVDGLLLVERQGRLGETYILGGEDISHRKFNHIVFEQAGVPPRFSLSIPKDLALLAARILDWLFRYETGSGYSAAVKMLLTEWRYNSGKAEADLGYSRTEFTEALQKTVDFVSQKISTAGGIRD